MPHLHHASNSQGEKRLLERQERELYGHAALFSFLPLLKPSQRGGGQQVSGLPPGILLQQLRSQCKAAYLITDETHSSAQVRTLKSVLFLSLKCNQGLWAGTAGLALPYHNVQVAKSLLLCRLAFSWLFATMDLARETPSVCPQGSP